MAEKFDDQWKCYLAVYNELMWLLKTSIILYVYLKDQDGNNPIV